MAAYVTLTPEEAVLYDKVKEVILKRYKINEETYACGLKKGKKYNQEHADCFRDHFQQ